jgi:hypothetical protein
MIIGKGLWMMKLVLLIKIKHGTLFHLSMEETLLIANEFTRLRERWMAV